MKSLEIPNLPDELYDAMEKLARARGVTIGDVAADAISKAFRSDDESTAEARLMEEVRAEREVMAARGVFLTDEFLDAAKKWGREG
jgi:hypothetical protein